MSEERRLLELAAKAAGVAIEYWHRDGFPVALIPSRGLWGWNPAQDDGDAMRLLARLRLGVDYRPGFVGVHDASGRYIGQCPHNETLAHDSAATRLAIVRAAAALGEKMDG